MKITSYGKRYELNGMVKLGITKHESGGISIKEVYFGPISGRIIKHSYSCWNKGDGTCEGDIYSVIGTNDPSWVDTTTWILENCLAEHKEMIENALDKHCPAIKE